MRPLPQPKGDQIKIYDSIVEAKHKVRRTTLAGLRDAVEQAYLTYKREGLCSLRAISLDDQQREALLHCYTAETIPLAKMREALLALAGSVCPYCGIDRPGTLDHFVPKEQFPEFSTYAPNLIACCDPCNRAKGENWATPTKRLFLHAYFDRFPAHATCLKAEVTWAGKGPSFKFSLDKSYPGLASDLFEILDEHVRRLELLDWYGKRAGEEFSDKSDWTLEEMTPDIVRRQIETNIRKKRAAEGPLSWRAALWTAVLQNNAAVDYLCAPTSQS